MHSSIIEINREALKNNIDFIRSLIKPKVTLSSVLKGNAYGHGIHLMVKLLQETGINHFSVFNSYEARQVFESAIQPCTIMIMGDIDENDDDWIIDNEIEFYVFNIERLSRLVRKVTHKKAVLNIHIEVETGMNRTGFNKLYWNEIIKIINQHKNYINVKGLCTHFAGAESISNYVRIKKQQKIFKKAINYFRNRDVHPQKKHCSCSAAVLAFPKQHYDMVRVGILQYGLWPSKESFIMYLTKNKLSNTPLQRILSWKSYIMDIKRVPKGEYIGYGNTFLTEEDTTVASIPVGYGYGYNRSLSNLGRVIIKDQRFGVVGIVNMNMLLVDITTSDNVSINDEVILIGSSEHLDISVSSFSSSSSELNYESLTKLDKNIVRIIT